MMYIYKARDKDGVVVTGEIDAESVKTAKVNLSGRGLFPIKVSPKESWFGNALRSFGERRKTKDLIAMTSQFAALFKAGITMDRILLALGNQTRNKGLKRAMGEIKNDVMGGESLMSAFGKHPKFFDEMYVNMLNAGEQGGILDKTLKDLAEILRREHRILSDIKSATLYPKVVIVTFVIAVAIIMTKVVPVFADFYSGYGSALPLPTRILIDISTAFKDYWHIALAAIAILFVVFKKYISTEVGRMQFDALKFKVPVFGKLNRLVVNSRFGHMMSVLYKSGLPLDKSLDITGRAVGNHAFKREIEIVNKGIDGGKSIAEAMEARKYFDPLVVESASAGEQSGVLDEMLETTAKFYDEEIDNMVSQLTTLIEPLLLVGLFGMVALLAFAVFLPMWNVNSLVLQAPN